MLGSKLNIVSKRGRWWRPGNSQSFLRLKCVNSASSWTPFRHKTITWTNVDLPSVWCNGIHLRAISQEIHESPITKLNLKITYLRFHSNLTGTNELTHKRQPRGCMGYILCLVQAHCVAFITRKVSPNPQNRHPIIRLWARNMTCLLWVRTLI